ncbi:MAG TPA: GAF domain-containing protein [Dehalococcoidia bacterium]
MHEERPEPASRQPHTDDQELGALTAVAEATASALDLDEILRTALDHVLDLTGADAAEALVLDEPAGEFVVRTRAGPLAGALEGRDRFRAGEGLPGAAAHRGELLVTRDVAGEPRLRRPALAAAGIRSFAALPLVSHRRTVGVVNVVSRDAARPADHDVRILTRVGQFLGMAVERALVHRRAQRLARQLEALNQASLALAADLTLDTLLQRIVDTARILIGARYAALGVAGPDGQLRQFLTSGISEEERRRIGSLPKGHGLLGAILHGREPIRVPDIGRDPRRFGFPPHHPEMHSFLGVPILLRGRNLGNLYLTEKVGEPEFTEEDEGLLVALAAHAAVAIENAQRFGQTHKELDRRLAELEAKNRLLAELSGKVISAQEEERRRVARDLHDDTAQALTSLLVQVRLLERAGLDESARTRLATLRELVDGALEGVRRMALDLRPPLLDDLGLVAAVDAYLREYRERWDLPTRLTSHGFPSDRLSPLAEVCIFRTVQEALTNAAKHARPSRVTVHLEHTGTAVVGWVEDDGCGFDPDTVRRDGSRGLGLFGMRERIGLVGGTLDIYSRLGEGTRVQFRVPLTGQERTDD